MKTESIGYKFGFGTGLFIFSTILYYVLSKANLLPGYIYLNYTQYSYYIAAILAVYVLYLNVKWGLKK